MKGEPMGDCMNFPDTVDEYMEQYKMTDTKQVYSNGIEYVPIFRMKQWFEHEKTQLSKGGATSDLISKTEVQTGLKKLPSAQPERPSGEWTEKEVIQFDDLEAKDIITEWQSAKCNVCGKYHTTPYMYYFDDYEYCPNCGANMRGKQDE